MIFFPRVRPFQTLFARFRPWLLPLLVGLVPLLLLHVLDNEEKERSATEALQSWATESAPMTHALEQMSAMEFWAEAFTRDLARSARKRMISGQTCEDAMPGSFADATPTWKGLPSPLVWGASFSRSGDRLLAQGLRHPGFQEYGRKVVADVLAETAGKRNNLPGNIPESLISSRIQRLFGIGTSSDLFAPTAQGKAFPVIFRGKFHLACWTLLIHSRQTRGAFLVLIPVGPQANRQAMRLTITNWKRFFPSRAFTAFLPLLLNHPSRTLDKTKAAAKISGRLPKPSSDILQELTAITKSWKIIPGTLSPATITREQPEGSLPAFNSLGRISLGGLTVGKAEPCVNGKFFRLFFPLNSCSGHVGVLISPATIIPGNLFTALFRGLLTIWTTGFLLALLRTTTGVSLPTFSLQHTLLLWILGLLLIPGTLGLGTSFRYLHDLREVRLERLIRNLETRVQQVENGFINFRKRRIQAINQVFNRAEILENLQALQISTPEKPHFPDHLWNMVTENRLPLVGIVISGHSGFCTKRFSRGIGPQQEEVVATVADGLNQKYLAGKSPKRAIAAPKAGNSNSLSEVLRKIISPDSQMVKLAPNGGEIGSQESRHVKYDLELAHNNQTHFLLTFIWDLQQELQDFYRTAASKDEGQLVNFGAVRQREGRFVPLGRWITPRTFRRNLTKPLQSSDKQRSAIISEPQKKLFFACKSNRNEQFWFAAVLNIEGFLDELEDERRYFQNAMLLLLLCTGFGALVAAKWVVDPITQMTQALFQLSRGNLGVQLESSRGDELGEAARTIDQMASWLREKDKVSRFVSGKVLEIISQNRNINHASGQISEVTFLVADIRSFTTVSEKHPPEKVFALLNAHFSALTNALQRNGGMVDRFIGDAVQAAFFTTSEGSSAEKALRAAQDVMIAHSLIRTKRIACGDFPYDIGVGLATGPITTGIVGDQDIRLDFTFLGEPLKRAHELEGFSKKGSASKIICDSETRQIGRSLARFHSLPGQESAFEIIDFVPSSSPFPDPRKVDSVRKPPVEVRVKGENPRPFTAGGPSAWPILAWLILGLLPIVLLGNTAQRYVNLRRTVAKGTLEKKLERGAHFLENRNSILPLLRGIVNSHLKALDRRRVSQGHNPKTLIPDVAATLKKLEKGIPGMGWTFVTFSPDSAGGDGSQVISEVKLSRNAPPALAGENMTQFQQFFRFYLGFSFSHRNQWNQLEKHLHMLVPPGTDLWDAFKEGCGGWPELRPDSPNTRFMWHPLFLRPSKSLIVSRENQHQLIGAIFLFLTPQVLAAQRHHSLAFDFFRRQGLIAAFPNGLDESIWSSPGSNAPPLSLPPHQERGEILFGNNLLLFQKTFMLDDDRVVLFGALPPGNQTLSHALKALQWVFALGWILAVLSLRWNSREKARRFLPLRISLPLAFLLLIGPLTALSILFSEKNGVAREFRLGSEMEQSLNDAAHGTEAGIPVYETAFVRHLQGRLRSFLSEQSPPFPPQAYPGTTSHDLPPLAILYEDGIAINQVFMVRDSGKISYLDTFSDESKKDKQDLFTRFFRELFLVSLRSLSPEKPSADQVGQKEFLSGARTEEVREALLLLSGPFCVANVLSHWEVQAKFEVGEVGFFLWRRYIRLPQEWVSVQANWNNRSIAWSFLNDLRDHPGRFPEIVSGRDRGTLLKKPYWSPFGRERTGFLTWQARKSWGSPELREISHGVFHAKAAVFSYLEDGNQEKVLLGVPGKVFSEFIYVAEGNLGERRAEVRQWTTVRRTVFALFLLGILLLAIRISRRVLTPILTLTDHTNRFMNGNFAIRLPDSGEDELGQLARTFNQLALAVEEGKVLKKFVSESVQLAAADRGREGRARDGEILSVVVLFAGVSRFDLQMKNSSPEKLIADLNAHLREMSGRIRQAGGEIDKFIGEKILAVFHSSRTGSDVSALQAALQASKEMREMFDSSRRFPGSHLGIGIVRGNVLAGIMGTPEIRLEYTVIGDNVNLASRLCDAALAEVSGGIIVEGAIADQAEVFPSVFGSQAMVRKLAMSSVKGKTREVHAYTIDWQRPDQTE